MNEHKYWGKVEQDWAGFSSGIQFSSPYFDNANVTIFLGEEFDEDGEEIELPSNKNLDAYEKTYLKFIENLEDVVQKIQVSTFDYYIKYYAHYFENEKKSGKKPLGISTKEKLFEYIRDINYIRILENDNIKIPIHFKIDTEHGIEVRLENNSVINVGGIAET
ncbi:DUF6985 domain-containing protein [Maribacter sp. Asnod1-A12]|uniref:DUF6985 domain-containing protein n=1 Tax=Maribacter sp. Asnod1-A12 TaxID=3160576 RepID=UPI003869A473